MEVGDGLCSDATRKFKVDQRVNTLCAAALLAFSGMALGQAGPGAQYGKIGGMNAGNAQACGTTKAQVAKLRTSYKASARQLFGAQADFEKSYDSAAAAAERKIVQAWKQGQYKPTTEVCVELMKQVRS